MADVFPYKILGNTIVFSNDYLPNYILGYFVTVRFVGVYLFKKVD